MILFTVLLILLLVFSVCAIFTIGTCGIVFVLMFGDVIICIGLIVIIIRYISASLKFGVGNGSFILLLPKMKGENIWANLQRGCDDHPRQF